MCILVYFLNSPYFDALNSFYIYFFNVTTHKAGITVNINLTLVCTFFNEKNLQQSLVIAMWLNTKKNNNNSNWPLFFLKAAEQLAASIFSAYRCPADLFTDTFQDYILRFKEGLTRGVKTECE